MNIYDSGAAGTERMAAARSRRRASAASSSFLLRPYRCSHHPTSRYAAAGPRAGFRPFGACSAWLATHARRIRAPRSQEKS